MNFDESSEHEDDVEEEGTRSLSPHTDTTRPASAASGKDVSVSKSRIHPASDMDCTLQSALR